jgi:hypothetical protein
VAWRERASVSGGRAPRTRFHNLCVVERWQPAAALRQQAQARLRARRPGTGEPRDVMLDDATPAHGGTAMAAGAQLQDPPTEADSRGHQDGGALLVDRAHVRPWGIQRSVTPTPCTPGGVPCHTTPPGAAPRLRACHAPAGVRGVGLCAASARCPTVVQAGREQRWPLASPLQRQRRLCTPGWQRTAGRSGRHRGRRRRTAPRALATPLGPVRARVVEAGGLEGSTLGPRHVICARTGTPPKRLGRVPAAPALAAAPVLRTDDKRWTREPGLKDLLPGLGRGQSQQRSSGAAGTPRPLVGCAAALLPPRRGERHGAPGQRTWQQVAALSTAAAPDQRRQVVGEDWLVDLKAPCHEPSIRAERERLRVA